MKKRAAMLKRNAASKREERMTKPAVSGWSRKRAATYALPQQKIANQIPTETK
jgi:hypothetical protein